MGISSLSLNIQVGGGAQQPASAVPRISGAQYPDGTLTTSETGLTNVTARQWNLNGSPVGGQTTNTYSGTQTAGSVISCTVTCDEGTLTSPAYVIYPSMMRTDDESLLNMMIHTDADCVAINDGDWSSTATWHTGAVPQAGDIVLIPNGKTVRYDLSSSPRFDKVRIDGTLNFAIDQNTLLLVETLLVTRGGTLTQGTGFGAASIPNAYTSEIRISNRNYATNPSAPTDMNLTEDTRLWGRGVISHGAVIVYGAARDAIIRTSTWPLAGHTSVTLATTPSNWQVGDEIDIPGTHYDFTFPPDTLTDRTERRTITDISGNVVSFSGGLTYDHDLYNDAASSRTDAQPPIINVTRNVTWTTEDHASLANYRRGHSVIMHQGATMDIWWLGIRGMGRTDKSIVSGRITGGAFEYPVGSETLGTTTLTSQSNLQSRYAFHCHHMGFLRDVDVDAHYVDIDGSPGWGAVHHSCEVNFFNFTIRRTYGAGMVSESGNETGAWADNVVYGLEYDPAPQFLLATDLKNMETQNFGMEGDTARFGYGYYFRGRAMRTNRNIAMGCTTGFGFFHRYHVIDGQSVNPPVPLQRSVIDIGDIAMTKSISLVGPDPSRIGVEDYPIIHHHNNEAWGCGWGNFVTKPGPPQEHGVPVNFYGFKARNCAYSASQTEYVGHYNFTDFDVIGCDPNEQPRSSGGAGIFLGNNVGTMAVSRGTLSYLDDGIVFHHSNLATQPTDWNSTGDPKMIVRDPTFVSNNSDYGRILDDGVDNTEAAATEKIMTTPTPVALSYSMPFTLWDYDGSSTEGNPATGTVTDTVGTRDVPYHWDNIGMRWLQGIENLADQNGYWTNGGDSYVLMPIYYAARTTEPGEIHQATIKRMHGVRLVSGQTSGRTNNGAFEISSTAPTCSDIDQAVTAGVAVDIDMLAGVTVEAGGTASIDMGAHFPLARPPHYAAQNGKISFPGGTGIVRYTPDPGYTGSDEFDFWIYDGKTQFVTRKVRLTIS